jgi:hypothetical protein
MSEAKVRQAALALVTKLNNILSDPYYYAIWDEHGWNYGYDVGGPRFREELKALTEALEKLDES